MVKVYYSYNFEKPVGMVSSKICNFAIDHKRKMIVAGSSQYVVLIAMKSGEIIRYLHKQGKNVPVRYIKLSSRYVYAAYEDGQIVVWNLDSYQIQSSFDLHKSAVSSISLSQDQIVMVSGGIDCQIIVWDMLSQQQLVIKNAHSNAITQVMYMSIIHKGKPINVILSIGKDGFLKVWNAQNKLCLGVISTQTTQAISMDYNIQRSLLYIGTNKQDLVLVKIHEDERDEICQVVGVFKRKNYFRCQQIQVHSNRLFLLGQKKIQIYELLSDQKLKMKKKRVISRKKNKEGQEAEPQEEISINQYQIHIVPHQQKTLLYKVYNFVHTDSKTYLNTGNDIMMLEEDKQLTHSSQKTLQLELQYPFLIQRSASSLKVFNYGLFNQLFTIPLGNILYCSLFNSGFLMIIEEQRVTIWDLAKNQSIFSLQQQWKGCWVKKNKCLLWTQNQLGLFDVGTDKKGRIKMKQASNKYFQDKIVSCMYRHSFDKYAVNLQNSQIHLHFADTNKNFVKLYGHKLPITSFDISSDDALLVSGSTDKDIRFWDLDFGYSVKTLFAHSQPVTAVKFIPNTHYVLSGGKDGHIKFWDGDTHQLIIDLQQNLLEIKSLEVTTAGDYIVAGGADGGFRVWKQSNDQTVAGDQQQKNMQKVMIEEYATDKLKQKQTKTRYQDLKHGQQIIQALENNQQPIVVVKLLKKIPPANLKSTLSFLHSLHVQKLQKVLRFLIGQRYEVQVSWRVLEALDRSSQLGKELRGYWQTLSKQLRVNKQSLRAMIKAVKEEKQFAF